MKLNSVCGGGKLSTQCSSYPIYPIYSNIRTILMHPCSYCQSTGNSLYVLTVHTMSVWSKESQINLIKYRQKSYCCPNCNLEWLT